MAAKVKHHFQWVCISSLINFAPAKAQKHSMATHQTHKSTLNCMLTAMAPASAAVSHCRGAVSTLHFVTDYKCIRWGQGASHKVKRLIQCLEKHKATFEQVWLSQLMHMSSACPRDRPLGLPGRYVGEYKGME